MAFIQATINFFYFLWRGQISLAFTYWVVGFAGNFAILVIPLLTLDSLRGPMSTPHWIHLAISGVYFLFSAVCVGRAAGKLDRSKTWPF